MMVIFLALFWLFFWKWAYFWSCWQKVKSFWLKVWMLLCTFVSQATSLKFLLIAHNKNYKSWTAKAYLLFVLLQKQARRVTDRHPPPPIFVIISGRTKVFSVHRRIYNLITKQRKQQISRLPPIQWPRAPVQEREEGIAHPGTTRRLCVPRRGGSPAKASHWRGHGTPLRPDPPASLGVTETGQAGGRSEGVTLRGETWCVCNRYG